MEREHVRSPPARHRPRRFGGVADGLRARVIVRSSAGWPRSRQSRRPLLRVVVDHEHAAEQQRRFRRRVRAHAPHAHADERPPQSDGSTAHLASVSAMSRRAATNTSISRSPTRRRDTLCRRRPQHCRDVARKIEQAHAIAALEHVLAVDQLHEAAGSREVVRLHFHRAERSCGIAVVCRHGPDTSNGTGRERIEVPARVRRRIACVIITGARA